MQFNKLLSDSDIIVFQNKDSSTYPFTLITYASMCFVDGMASNPLAFGGP